ncbi:hypothetical protein LXL04_022218 [Taraxacum kok-saghyz]
MSVVFSDRRLSVPSTHNSTRLQPTLRDVFLAPSFRPVERTENGGRFGLLGFFMCARGCLGKKSPPDFKCQVLLRGRPVPDLTKKPQMGADTNANTTAVPLS